MVKGMEWSWVMGGYCGDECDSSTEINNSLWPQNSLELMPL